MSVPHIPGFRIQKKLAEGRRSVLYLAEQQSLQRPVALKILTGEMASDSDSRRRLLDQEKAAARLTHPNILAVFDIGEHQGSHYIATEYVTGGTLRDKLERKAVSPELALAITRDLAQGLSFLHEQGFLHRDIKPSNILFREDGGAVLGDTGIMRMEDAAQMEVSFGSPHYMSPEQAQSQPCDGRSDLYSLGVVLFEMLAGRPPFDAEDPFQVAIQHITEAPPGLPASLAKLQPLLTRLLAKQPTERFTSAAQLVQVLEQALAKSGRSGAAPQPVAARPVSMPTMVQPPVPDPAATVVHRPTQPDPAATVVNRPLAPDPAATVVNRPVLPDPAATVVNRPLAPDPAATVVNRPVLPDPGATVVNAAIDPGATMVQPAVPDAPHATHDAATVVHAVVGMPDPITQRMDQATEPLVEPVFPPTFPAGEPRRFEVPRYVEPQRRSFAWLWILLTLLLVGGGVALWWFVLRGPPAPTITIPRADSSQLAGTAAAGGAPAVDVTALLDKVERLQSSGVLVADDAESAASVMAEAVRAAPTNPNVMLARQELMGLLLAAINQALNEGRATYAGSMVDSALKHFPEDPELQAVRAKVAGP